MKTFEIPGQTGHSTIYVNESFKNLDAYVPGWNALALLLLLRLRRHFKTDGHLFLTYLAIYSVGRIVLSTVRQEKIWFWGLQEAQVFGIVVLVVAAVLAVYLTRRSRGVTAQIAVPVHQSQ